MKLTVVYDHRFARTPDGAMWSKGNLGYGFLARYLQVFEEIRVLCREEQTVSPPPGFVLASGAGVRFAPFGSFRGIAGYLRHGPSIIGQLRKTLTTSDGSAFLVRVPAVIGSVVTDVFRKGGTPYAVEVVGDPRSVFGWGRPAGPAGLGLRVAMSAQLRQQVRSAVAVGYVPSPQLQERYPAGEAAVTEEYSSLALDDEALLPAARRIANVPSPLRIVTVASMDWPYKGIDVLLRAVRILLDDGLKVTLTVVGAGRLRSRYEKLAATLGLADACGFTGQVSAGREIRRYLDGADLFVLASLSEGLPRAMVEAMARGMPCVGTEAGGIPTLLGPKYCARPGDADDLARVIRSSTGTAHEMNEVGAANLLQASAFRATETYRRSRNVYEALREATTRHWHTSAL
jgi:phosphatidyl-myo-inositol dimannoside synthase